MTSRHYLKTTTHDRLCVKVGEEQLQNLFRHLRAFINQLREDVCHANLHVLAHRRTAHRVRKLARASPAIKRVPNDEAHLTISKKPLKRSYIISSAPPTSQMRMTDLTVLSESRR